MTNTCHQWIVPWIRTRGRTSGVWNENWRLLYWVLPTAGIHLHWAWHLSPSAPQGGTAVIHASPYRQRGRKVSPVSSLRCSPEPLLLSSHLWDAAGSFIFCWASAHKIHLRVGGSSPNLLPCCSQSYFHYWYITCYLCNSLYLEKQMLDSGKRKISLIALSLLPPPGWALSSIITHQMHASLSLGLNLQ